MLEHMDSRELTEWHLLFDIRAEERDADRAGGIVKHGDPNRTQDDEDDDEETDEADGPEVADWITAHTPPSTAPPSDPDPE